MTSRAAVVPTAARIPVIDALRGFALFGILLVNMRAWSGWSGPMPEAHRLALSGSDMIWWYSFFCTALLEGKFYTIFAFLFGWGASLQLDRIGPTAVKVYRRRLQFLLIIGISHMVLLWAGDILALYAILGFAVLLSRRLDDRTLLITAAGLVVLPIAGVWLVLVAGVDPDLRFFELGRQIFLDLGGNYDAAWQWRERADWSSFIAWNLAGPWFRIGELLMNWRAATVLGTMLVGTWAARRKNRLLEDRQYLLRVAIWGTLIGLPASIVLAVIGGLVRSDADVRMLGVTAYALGVVPLGLAYAAAFALICTQSQWLSKILAPAGRMALTNYLAQSLLGVTIFYGVGFGLINQVNPVQFTAMGAAIFALQICWSHLWLAHCRHGPIEYFWRRHVYR